MMNKHELATVAQHDTGAKAIFLNNYHLGMVVQGEDRFYGGTRGDTYFCDTNFDFVQSCNVIEAEKVTQIEKLDGTLKRLIKSRHNTSS